MNPLPYLADNEDADGKLPHEVIAALATQRDELAAELAEAKAALRPFAEHFVFLDGVDSHTLMLFKGKAQLFKDAKAALAAQKGAQG